MWWLTQYVRCKYLPPCHITTVSRRKKVEAKTVVFVLFSWQKKRAMGYAGFFLLCVWLQLLRLKMSKSHERDMRHIRFHIAMRAGFWDKPIFLGQIRILIPISYQTFLHFPVCSDYLGMKSGDIPDANIQAVSYNYYPAHKGRLNDEPSCWSLLGSRFQSPWIQADISYQTYVSGVITQGDGGFGGNANWVTSLKVSTFGVNTNDTEEFVKDGNGQVKVSVLPIKGTSDFLIWLNVSDYVVFETLKHGSLIIENLASNHSFIYRNVFRNGVNAISKMVNNFLSKKAKFCVVQTKLYCLSFTSSMWSKYLLNDVRRDFRISM